MHTLLLPCTLRRRSNLNHIIAVKQRVFVHPFLCISTRIAYHPCAVEQVVKTVMSMTVHPQLRALTVRQVLQIGYKAAIEQ